MEQLIRILHLEDDPADAELVQAKLESANLTCQITRVQACDEFDRALRQCKYDVILADYQLPMYDGVSALRLAQEVCPDIPFIFVSGVMGEDAAIEGLTRGATDYVLKQKLARLAPAAKRALSEAENQRGRKRAQELIVEREAELAAIYENAPLIMVLVDQDRRVRKANHMVETFAGRPAAEMIGLRCGEALGCLNALDSPHGCGLGVHCGQCAVRRTTLDTLESGTSHLQVEASLPFMIEGKRQNLVFLLSAARLEIKKRAVALVSLLDITRRKQAEDQTRRSLQENQALLKEIHHRVKNNMQLILSLLNLQATRISDPQTLDLFKIAEGRIRAMALVQERLYQSPNLAQVQFADYIQRLATKLFQALCVDPDVVHLKIKVGSDMVLSIDQAVPCGLLIHELLTNSLRHAFLHREGDKEIDMEMRLDGERQVTLVVSDNGVGLPPVFNWRNSPTLGLQLVMTLVKQLDGSIELDSSRGTRFMVRFEAGVVLK